MKAVCKNPDQDEQCPNCGIRYGDLRTGETFQTIKDMLWVDDDDYRNWRHKRKGTVLGLWFQIKQSLWRDHLKQCEAAAEWEAAGRPNDYDWPSDDKDFEY